MRAAIIAAALAAGACGESETRLVTASMIDGDAIPAPLGAAVGDAVKGRAVFVEREGGHCVLCHAVEGLDAPFQGNVGPALDDVGARLTRGQIRLRVADPRLVWPDTVMPSYYRVHGLAQVPEELSGEPVLGAEQIEDLVAWLATLDGDAET